MKRIILNDSSAHFYPILGLSLTLIISSDIQLGTTLQFMWAYHSTSDIQPNQFQQHSSRGFQAVAIPGMSVICNQFISLKVVHRIWNCDVIALSSGTAIASTLQKEIQPEYSWQFFNKSFRKWSLQLLTLMSIKISKFGYSDVRQHMATRETESFRCFSGNVTCNDCIKLKSLEANITYVCADKVIHVYMWIDNGDFFSF